MQYNDYILETSNLSKVYDSGPNKVRVLDTITLRVFRGEIVIIMGPSGVGKSTLLNLFGTLDQPTGGQLLVAGEDVLQFNEQKLARFRNEHIGFIFQFHYLLPEFTALENVLIPRMIKGKDWETEEGRARKLLSEVGLQHRLHHKPKELSGGEQQRVAIARALMNHPKLILADEPTGDLDRSNSRALFNLILELNQKYQQTFIIVTHDEMFAEQAHRIIHLADGKVGQKNLKKRLAAAKLMPSNDYQQHPLDISTEYLKGVGPRRAAALQSVGIETLADLLEFRPRRYLDRSTVRYIRDIMIDDEVTVMGEVIAAELTRWGKRRLVVRIHDGSGILEAVWFNQADLFAKIFKPQQTVAFSGKVSRYRHWQMVHPDFDIISEEREQLNTGQLIPLYPSNQDLKKAGLSNYSLRKIISLALRKYRKAIPETLPAAKLQQYYLLSRADAYWQMHFPDSEKMLHQLERRFKYEELFYLELLMALRKHFFYTPVEGPTIQTGVAAHRNLIRSLPFSLTGAQQRVLREIEADLQSGQPMNRLVQGDVGSGKTIVALLAMHLAITAGYQAALMAPTEILAQQHYFNINSLLTSRDIEMGLLIGSLKEKEKERLQRRIAEGDAQLLVGTHALIQEKVSFEKLGLVVIDEQHRFGVLQRGELVQKGRTPHTLVMTATPIPRTLALTVYGDLDVSVIDELPPGRQEIRTFWRTTERLELIYDFIRQRLEAGEQAYVVYPLVEESEKLDLKAATEAYQHLQKTVFREYRLALLHGRLKMSEKEDIMARFKDGHLQLLVSTTVIEVGVDVPNATLMVIEHAERFGLSQLHQLRGRVGRGEKRSYCILVTPAKVNEVARERLQVMTETNDGFVIAEEDLRLRGSGEFFGTRQHGLPDLKYANLVTDQNIIQTAREDAFKLVEEDPHLRLPTHAGVRTHFKRQFVDKFHLPNIA